MDPENQTPVEQPTEAKPDSLTGRAALEHALDIQREVVPAPAAPVEKPETPTAKEVKAAVDSDPEPPSEFTAKGKEAWKQKDIRGIQEEYQRISTSRLQELSRAQASERTAKEEAKKAREIEAAVNAYVEDRLIKEGVSKPEALAQAAKLAHALRTNRKESVEELRKLGFKILDEDGTAVTASADNSQITAMQEQLNNLLEEKRQREFQSTAQLFAQSITTLAAEKTRTGDPLFPGFYDSSEAGKEFAKELGSLTKEPLFQSLVLRRIPNATHVDLVREAYVQLGGTVAKDQTVRVSKNNPQQIEKSRRAAASSPGGVVSRDGREALVGKLSSRAAMKKAIELNQEH